MSAAIDTIPLSVVPEFWRSLGLRSMTANALAAEGINSLEALAALSENKIRRIYSIGTLGVRDIQRLLIKHAQTPDAPAALSSITDGDLIVELLRRGYRVDRAPNA